MPASRHDDAVVFLESRDRRGVFLVILGIEPVDLWLHAELVGGEFDGLDNGNVRIGEDEIARIEIFADDAYLHNALAVVRMLGELFPLRKIGGALRFLPQHIHEYLGELVAFEIQRNVVDGCDIGRGDDVFRLDVARDRQFFFALFVERQGGAGDDDIGLHAVGIEHADRRLRRLRFHLADRARHREI